MGAKYQYSDEIRNAICEGLAEGKSLRKVCEQDGFPAPSTVLGWIKDNIYPEFSEQYTRARQIGYQMIADELFAIADDSSKDTIKTNKGDIENKEWTSRSRLRLDTRKWYLSKMLPKVYGDKLTLQGDAENPITVAPAYDTSKLSVEELELWLEIARKMKPVEDNNSDNN